MSALNDITIARLVMFDPWDSLIRGEDINSEPITHGASYYDLMSRVFFAKRHV
jgi:hypothetical protein